MGCAAEEVADARLLGRSEALRVIEALTLDLLKAVARGEDPEMFLVRAHIASSFFFILPPSLPPSITPSL